MQSFQCPKDSSHARFQGLSYKRCEFAVDLGPDASVIRETFRAEAGPLSSAVDHEVVCLECGTVVRPMRSGLPYMPAAGTMLKCDFTRGFVRPEMIKIRPVVVISERERNRDTVIVVGCSGNQPRDTRTIAVPLPVASYPFLVKDNWAKCDMVYAVSRARLASLDDKNTGQFLNSKDSTINPADLAAIREGVKQAIGLP